jgi:hypothetical protein
VSLNTLLISMISSALGMRKGQSNSSVGDTPKNKFDTEKWEKLMNKPQGEPEKIKLPDSSDWRNRRR